MRRRVCRYATDFFERERYTVAILIGRWKMRKKWRERKVEELEGKRVGEWK